MLDKCFEYLLKCGKKRGKKHMNTIGEGSDFSKPNPLILSLCEKKICIKIEHLQRLS